VVIKEIKMFSELILSGKSSIFALFVFMIIGNFGHRMILQLCLFLSDYCQLFEAEKIESQIATVEEFGHSIFLISLYALIIVIMLMLIKRI
jgi:hypothetical protein